jgi:phage terminase large subunit-like protein
MTMAKAPRRRASKPKKNLPSEKFRSFCAQYLTHVHGPQRGQPFLLEEWQMERIIRPLYDTIRKDGLRQYRTSYVEIGRKNGKSFLAMAVALYGLICDGEPGAQVISAAGTREQASLVFDVARAAILANPILRRMCRVYKKVIETQDGSTYKVVSADGFNAHGLSISTLIFDELWVQKKADLYEALTTSMGARRQPLSFLISTSGFDKNTICYQTHSYAKRIRDGIVEDPTFLPVLFGAPEEADWKDRNTWLTSNPNLGVSVSEEFLANACREAQENPAKEISFRQFFLSQWVSAESRWFSLDKIDAAMVEESDWPDLTGKDCFLGLDLSSTTDLTSIAAVWPIDGIFYLDTWSWAPRGALTTRERANRTRFQPWEKSGHVIVTDGEVIDYTQIHRHIEDMATRYNIREIAVDKWNSVALSNQLQSEGHTVVAFPQGFASMSPASKDFEALVSSGKVRIRKNPLYRWAFTNVSMVQDPAGNVRPDKSKSGDKIDPVIASVMSMARARHHEASSRSGYESGGLMVL